MKRYAKIFKTLLCASIIFNFQFSINSANAQKYAVVNTDYVMKTIPDYANAQKRLDQYVAEWTQELGTKQAELDAMRKNYEQESYLLPDNLKTRRQEEIKAKEAEVRALQQQRFGAGGDLDKRRADPIRRGPLPGHRQFDLDRQVRMGRRIRIVDDFGFQVLTAGRAASHGGRDSQPDGQEFSHSFHIR